VCDPPPGHSGWVVSVAYSPDGKHIVSGSNDKTVRIWDAETGAAVCDPLLGHSGRVDSVAYSPDGKHIVSGSGDKTVRIWNAETGAAVCDPPPGHSGWVVSVAYSPDGKHIVSGSNDKTVRIWNAETGAAVCDPLLGHSSCVYSVAYSPDGKHIVSGSGDNTVRIWDADTSDAREGTHVKLLSSFLHPSTPQNQTASPPLMSSSRLTRWLCPRSGWIGCGTNTLLFWLPPGYRNPDDSIIRISRLYSPAPILSFTQFVHGESWIRVHDQEL
jgi:WD40 repeat protein